MDTSNQCGIYVIHQIGTQRFYVGSSVQLKHRWREHLYLLRRNKHHCVYLQNAWNKHGEGDFVFEIWEECPTDRLIEREQFWFDQIGKSRLFNLALVAGSRLGIPQSPETIEKVRQVQIGWNLRPGAEERRKHISEALTGNPKVAEAQKGWQFKPGAEERRRHISEALTGKPGHKQTPENTAAFVKMITGNKFVLNRKNYHHSPETIAKISSAQKGRVYPDRHGKKRSPEVCAKISAGLTGRYISPESIEKMRQSHLGKKLKPESIAKREETKRLNREKSG